MKVGLALRWDHHSPLALAAAMAALVAVACGAAPAADPTLDSVVPDQVRSDEDTAISILGEGWFTRVTPDLASPQGVRVRDDFRAGVAGASAAGELVDVRWQSNGELSAVVPAGLSSGIEARITLPNRRRGHRPSVLNAFRHRGEDHAGDGS